MKIVIDIPDDDFYKISKINKEQKIILDSENVAIVFRVIKAVKNGAPLPKRTCNLIDVGQCDKELFYQQCGGADSLITVKSAFDMLMSLPTIIEAESEEIKTS